MITTVRTDKDKRFTMRCLAILSLVTLTTADLEIAPYQLVEEHDGWEVRRYPPTRWVSTQATDLLPHNGGEHSKVITQLPAF